MFLGTFEPNLMEGSRIALPKKIREELGGQRVILTVGFDQCIFGFTEKAWEEATKPELMRPLFSDPEGREIRRKMFSEALLIELDSQGRFIIPERMITIGNIKNNVLVIGAGDHFEIWDKQKWESYREEMR
jgi:MraZ protein